MTPTNLIVMGALALLGCLSMGYGESFNPASGHINQALTNLVAKHPTRYSFIADEIANVIPVEKESDFYWFVDNPANLDQSARTLKAPGGESNRIELNWHTDSYQTQEHALHDDLPHRTRDNADSMLGLEMEHVAAVRDSVQMAKEIRSAAILFSSTYMTNTGGVTSAWDGATAASIKPWNDLIAAAYLVSTLGGGQADHVAMGAKTWKSLAIWLMAQGGTGAGIRWGGVAELLKENPALIPQSIAGLQLRVGNAMKSSAARPANVSRAASGGNLSEVWNGSVLVYYRGQPGIKSIQLAARFMKSGWPRVRQGTYADTRASDWYEYAENESGVKVVAPSCGYLITSVNT
jgi:hypothetical protein